MKTYLIEHNGEQRGPYSVTQLKHMWDSGAITVDSFYWAEGMTEWKPAADLLEEGAMPLEQMEATTPAPSSQEKEPAIPPHETDVNFTSQPADPPRSEQKGPIVDSPKRKRTALLFALFLGSLGLHNFYLGFNGRGLSQLLITVLLWPFGGFFISATWALIEAVLIYLGRLNRDAAGLVLKASPIAVMQTPASADVFGVKKVTKTGTFGKILATGACIVVLIIVISSISSKPDSGNLAPAARPLSVEQVIGSGVQAALTRDQQKIFDSVYPVGTAKSVVVHEIVIDAWKRGQATGKIEDVKQFTVTYTLYWEAQLVKDGFSKISQTFDMESQRFIGGQVLASNAMMTKSDIGEALGYIGGALLYDALHGN